MSSCKRMFINYILSENTKNAKVKEMIERNRVLKKQFRDSVNVCIPNYIEKYNVLLYVLVTNVKSEKCM